MPGFDNGVMYASNVDFTTASLTSGSAQVLADGQLLIGSTATPNIKVNTLTAGTGIGISNGSGSITISATGAGFSWSDISGAFSPLKENGYFVTGTATGTLPASPAQGDTIKFIVDTTQILTIQATGTQVIRLGAAVSSAAGTIVSANQGDAITLVYRTSDTAWIADSSIGNLWTTA
jgi:hypothetical protein